MHLLLEANTISMLVCLRSGYPTTFELENACDIYCF